MATSAYPFFAGQTPRTQVIAHSALRVAQVAAMITPPLFILSSIVRRNPLKPFTIKRLLNSTVRSTAVGAAFGGLMGWGRLRNEPETAILDRAERLVSPLLAAFLERHSVVRHLQALMSSIWERG